MRRLLMTVDAAFNFRPGGATLAPALPLDALPQPYPVTAALRRPDGSETSATVRFSVTHFNRPYTEGAIENTWMLTVWLPDLDKADVPAGSEIWLEAQQEA